MAIQSAACVIDTSAIVVMFSREPEAEAMAIRMGNSPNRIVPPSCIVEFCMLRRIGRNLDRWIADFIDEYEVAVLPLTAEIAWMAAVAAKRFGRGSGHRANLNFGDCMSYAIARVADAPLLYKGNDFVLTDILPVTLP